MWAYNWATRVRADWAFWTNMAPKRVICWLPCSLDTNCHSLMCHFPPKPHLMTFGQQIKPTSGLPKWQGVVVAECQSLIYLWGTCRLISWKKRAQHSAVITARTPFDLSAHTSIGNSTSCTVPPLTVGIIRKNTAGLGSVLTNWHQAANLCVSAASKGSVQGYSHRAVLDMG